MTHFKIFRVVLFLPLLIIISCGGGNEQILETYYEALTEINYDAFKSVVHPELLTGENDLTREEFKEQVAGRFFSDGVDYSELTILNEYGDVTNLGDEYTIIVYRQKEEHSFDKGSRMKIFYRNLQEGGVGREVDQQSISIDGESKKISFQNTYFSLLVKKKDETSYKLVPVCRRSIFEKILGEEMGNRAFNEYNDYYRLIIEPGL